MASTWIGLVRLLAVLVLVVGGALPAHAASIHRTTSPTGAARAVELHVWHRLNADRAAHGLGPLALDAALSRVARAHSRDMFRRHYFAHETPEGISPFQRMAAAGIRYMTAGENLGEASGYAPQEAGTRLDAEMMAEPPNQENHRAIILDRGFHKVGVGVYASGGSVFLTEDFTN